MSDGQINRRSMKRLKHRNIKITETLEAIRDREEKLKTSAAELSEKVASRDTLAGEVELDRATVNEMKAKFIAACQALDAKERALRLLDLEIASPRSKEFGHAAERLKQQRAALEAELAENNRRLAPPPLETDGNSPLAAPDQDITHNQDAVPASVESKTVGGGTVQKKRIILKDARRIVQPRVYRSGAFKTWRKRGRHK